MKKCITWGILVGILLATKFTGALFLITSFVLLFFTQHRKSIINLFFHFKKWLTISILISLFVVWATYFFRTDVVIAKRQDSNRLSSRLKEQAKETNNEILSSALYILENQKLPLGNYLATVKNNVLRANEIPQVFFLGEWYNGSRWYFMIVTIFLKTPIPLLLLFFYSFLRIFTRFPESPLIFIVPIVAIFLVASFSGMMPWTRYVLPVIPFVAIVATVVVREARRSYEKVGVVLLLSWYLYGTLSQFPHFVSYANELAGPKNERYKLFTDSNLDWGQSIPDLVTYIEKEKPRHISFSYFGRDRGDVYGLVSNREWGSYKFEEICAFHEIEFPYEDGGRFVLISVSNWHICGYKTMSQFTKDKIVDTVGDSILIFKQ